MVRFNVASPLHPNADVSCIPTEYVIGVELNDGTIRRAPEPARRCIPCAQRNATVADAHREKVGPLESRIVMIEFKILLTWNEPELCVDRRNYVY